MTLIVGIKCTDGVVIAADGATTFSTLGNRTIRQPSRKLNIIGDRMIVGVSGPVGLQQRFVGELEGLQLGTGVKRHQVMEILAGSLRKHMRTEFQNVEVVRPTLGNLALESAISSTLIAIVVQNEPTLIQFDQQGAPECATDQLRFVSLGSGQPLADPFLAFLRKIFWATKPPTLSDGIFAATWALTHPIDTNPGGVGDPIQVITLRVHNGAATIAEILEPELAEHREAIRVAEQRLATFRDAITPASEGTQAGEIPTPE